MLAFIGLCGTWLGCGRGFKTDMGKVTIYSRTGKVLRKDGCVRVQSYLGSMRMVVTEKGGAGKLDKPGEGYYLTNLSIVAEDGIKDAAWRKPESSETPSVIIMYSDDGKEIRTWSGVRGIAYQMDIVTFYVGEKWFNVVGNLVIEPEE